ncbi:hypothetical protein EI94DRAFT_1698291 [Lactarius quietus]|nr:hypothetical protein EI94DRAFT_1698291 [Lactarius quietus]
MAWPTLSLLHDTSMGDYHQTTPFINLRPVRNPRNLATATQFSANFHHTARMSDTYKITCVAAAPILENVPREGVCHACRNAEVKAHGHWDGAMQHPHRERVDHNVGLGIICQHKAKHSNFGLRLYQRIGSIKARKPRPRGDVNPEHSTQSLVVGEHRRIRGVDQGDRNGDFPREIPGEGEVYGVQRAAGRESLPVRAPLGDTKSRRMGAALPVTPAMEACSPSRMGT